MGQAVQRNKREHKARARKKLQAGSPRSEFSQRETGVGQGIKGAQSQHAGVARPAPVICPVTHIAAGMQVPVSNKTLKSRYGIGERPVDGALLEYADLIEQVLSAGLDNNWTTPAAVENMLSSFHFGSPEQGKESFSLANQVLNTIYGEVLTINEPIYKKLATYNYPAQGIKVGNVTKANGGDWENYFVAGTYRPEVVSEYNVSPTGLIAGESGLCVMFSEMVPDKLNEPLDDLTINIAQFVQFCCTLSDHASTLDMVQDDIIKWMAIGEYADLDTKDEAKLIEASGSYDTFHAAMESIMGEDYIHELFIDPDTLANYYKSHKQASLIQKKLKPFNQKNVSSFLKKIKKSAATPEWLITATELLLNQCDWSINMNKAIQSTGHMPFAFTKPYGFGFSIDEHIFNSLHENFMNEEEDVVSICIPFGADTARVLANLDLGETLLLFANEMLYTHSDA